MNDKKEKSRVQDSANRAVSRIASWSESKKDSARRAVNAQQASSKQAAKGRVSAGDRSRD
jgi:hypothetical protein